LQDERMKCSIIRYGLASELIVPEPLTVTEITAISDLISVQPDAVAEAPQFITNCMNQCRMATYGGI